MAERKEQRVRHNAERQRFELDTIAGLAVADYHLAGDTMTLYHTEVPASLRGRGIGYRLVCGVLQEARHLGLAVVPACWFVRDVIARRPEFQDLLK
jgi:predicted GNAT family acetyltransferase